MGKCKSYFFKIALFLGITSIVLATTVHADITVYFNDGFEQIPTELRLGNSECKITNPIGTVAGLASNYLKYTAPKAAEKGSIESGIIKRPGEHTVIDGKKVSIEIKFFPTKSGDKVSLFGLTGMQDGEWMEALLMTGNVKDNVGEFQRPLIGGGTKKISDDAVYTLNTWNHIFVVLDCTTSPRTYSIYLNGKLLESEIALPSAIANINALKRMDINMKNWEWNAEEVYFDDYIVQSIDHLTLQKSSVADGQTNVDSQPTIFLDFNTMIDTETLSSITVNNENCETIPVQVSRDPVDGTRCILNFDTPLKDLTRYNIFVDGLKDTFGTTLEGEALTFVTGERIAINSLLVNDSPLVDWNEFQISADGQYVPKFILDSQKSGLKVSLLAVVYHNGILETTSIETVTLDLGENAVSLEPIEGKAGRNIKLFVWDSLSSMQPILRKHQL